jgi:GNAT superfamily N-acetyltransferase
MAGSDQREVLVHSEDLPKCDRQPNGGNARGDGGKICREARAAFAAKTRFDMDIRGLSARFEPEAGALFRAAYPDRIVESTDWRSSTDDRVHRIAIDGEHVVAYGSTWRVAHNKFRMDLIVIPARRRHGIGGALLEHLIEIAQRDGAATLQARADEDAADSLAFLDHRGFVETMRMRRMTLHVPEARTGAFADLERMIAGRGITITTLSERLQSDPDTWAQLGDVYDSAGDEWPDPDPGGPREPLTAEKTRAMFERWNARHDAVFLAEHSVLSGAAPLRALVGFAGLAGPDARPIGAGVRPAFRGLGIMTALKTRVIEYARNHGIATLRTSSGHPAMIRVNEKLGYVRAGAEVRLVRKLVAQSPPHADRD